LLKKESTIHTTLPNGDICWGKFARNSGRGVWCNSNGEIYDGNWLNGKYHGQGKFIFTDGSIYEGEFNEGNITGVGVCKKNNGAIYEGEFLNGKFCGQEIDIL